MGNGSTSRRGSPKAMQQNQEGSPSTQTPSEAKWMKSENRKRPHQQEFKDKGTEERTNLSP